MAKGLRCRHAHPGDFVFQRLDKRGNGILVAISYLRQRHRRIATRYLGLVVSLQCLHKCGNRGGPDASQCIDHCLQENRITVPECAIKRRHSPFADAGQGVGRGITHHDILVVEDAYEITHRLIGSGVNLTERPGCGGSYCRVVVSQPCIQIMRTLLRALSNTPQRGGCRCPHPGIVMIEKICEICDSP